MASIEEIQKLFKPIEKQTESLHEKFDKLQESLTIQHQISKENQIAIADLEKEMKQKDHKIEQLERKLKEKNLLLFGIEEDNNELLENKILNVFKDQMRLNNFSRDSIEDAEFNRWTTFNAKAKKIVT